MAKPGGRWRLGAAIFLLGLAGALAWSWRAATLPDPRTATLQQWAGQLRARDSVLHRTVGRWLGQQAPGLARHFPRWLGVESTAAHRRLEACHALVAQGTEAGTVLREVVEAFCDRDHDVRAYAFIVLVHAGVAASDLVARVRHVSLAPEVQARHCAGLLATEDEQMRELAWACLEAFDGEEFAGSRKAVEDLAAQSHDAALAGRARRLLAQRTAVEPGGAVSP